MLEWLKLARRHDVLECNTGQCCNIVNVLCDIEKPTVLFFGSSIVFEKSVSARVIRKLACVVISTQTPGSDVQQSFKEVGGCIHGHGNLLKAVGWTKFQILEQRFTPRMEPCVPRNLHNTT